MHHLSAAAIHLHSNGILAIRRPRDGATPWSARLGRTRCSCRWRRFKRLRFGGATLRRQCQCRIVAFGNGHEESRWKTYRNLVSMPNDRSGRQSGGQEKSEKDHSLHVPCFLCFGEGFLSCWGLSIAIIALQRGMPSERMSSARVGYVPALCAHRASLLPIEWLREAFGLAQRGGRRPLRAGSWSNFVV